MHHTQPMPYGMYLVDKSYIDELRKHESKIIGSDVTNLYCGPVLRVDDEWAFYAPVLPMPDYVNDELFLSKDMAVSGFVYVCKMIPCCTKVLTVCMENTPESEFCLKSENRQLIEWMAKTAYEELCGEQEEE